MEVLWLASWYPNKVFPYDGDFIQRHAKAVSDRLPLTVIYVYQYGQDLSPCETNESKTASGHITEHLFSFRYWKTGIRYFDKLIYNWQYFRTYRRVLKNYFRKNGTPDLIHLHIPMKAGLIAIWVKRKFGISFIVTEHASTYDPVAPDFFGRRSLYYRKAVRQIFLQASGITNVSESVAGQVNKLLGMDKSFVVIPNVVDDSLFYYRPSAQSVFRFIHVSGMTAQKNPEGIVEAFTRLSRIRLDWELWLIGPAPGSLKKMVEVSGIASKVIFTGEVKYDEVAGFMQSSSALVMFSRHENSPCVILEALSCGLPVISTDVGGISESVDQANGILIPSNNGEALLEALEKMMDNYSNYSREKIAEAAKERYSRKVIADKFLSYYQAVLGH